MSHMSGYSGGHLGRAGEPHSLGYSRETYCFRRICDRLYPCLFDVIQDPCCARPTYSMLIFDTDIIMSYYKIPGDISDANTVATAPIRLI